MQIRDRTLCFGPQKIYMLSLLFIYLKIGGKFICNGIRIATVIGPDWIELEPVYGYRFEPKLVCYSQTKEQFSFLGISDELWESVTLVSKAFNTTGKIRNDFSLETWRKYGNCNRYLFVCTIFSDHCYFVSLFYCCFRNPNLFFFSQLRTYGLQLSLKFSNNIYSVI